MAKTYIELSKEIELLKTRAEAVRRQEKAGVVGRIKEAITIYELTAEELGFNTGATGLRGKQGRIGARGASAKSGSAAAKKAKSPARYRDDQGHSWTGMGPRPGWLKAALDAGRSLESMAVAGDAAAAADGSGPERSTRPATARSKAPKKQPAVVKYKDDAGHVWTGRGPRPRWLKEAIAGGKALEQLAA